MQIYSDQWVFRCGERASFRHQRPLQDPSRFQLLLHLCGRLELHRGAAAGGAAGAGDVVLTRGKPAEIPVETRVSFRVQEPVTITERLQ